MIEYALESERFIDMYNFGALRSIDIVPDDAGELIRVALDFDEEEAARRSIDGETVLLSFRDVRELSIVQGTPWEAEPSRQVEGVSHHPSGDGRSAIEWELGNLTLTFSTAAVELDIS